MPTINTKFENALIYIVCIIFILVVFIGGYSLYYQATVVYPKAYKAWVKQTGNEKNLTYEEWRVLNAVQRSMVK